eukprot:GAHX01002152.1.p1 GENE.GAHX01002152.1~~GAHX01002152.1.p1  ORF type:complete len:58 (-),score=4.93 GAHX01002152.1:43-216(-)
MNNGLEPHPKEIMGYQNLLFCTQINKPQCCYRAFSNEYEEPLSCIKECFEMVKWQCI